MGTIRSANWIWAEYQNMASNGMFNAYASVQANNANTPQVNNASGATNIALTSAWLNGTLITNGASAAAVFVCWGTSDAGTNAGPVFWANTNTWPAPQLPGAFTTNQTGLSSNATYYYRFAASNAAGMAWASTSPFFMTGPIGVDVTANASEIGLTPGLFTIRRPGTTTNEAVTVNYTISGTATAGVNYVNNLGTSIVIPAGASNTTLTVTPINNWGNQSDTTIILTPTVGQYPDSSANGTTLIISNRPLPTVTGSGTIHYVSPYGTAVSPYTSWATAATNISPAVGVAVAGDTVAVLSGTYTLSSEIALSTAITIMSVDGAGYTNTMINGGGVGRVFNITANALVDGFTITNGYAATTGGGGVKMTAGTVQNCLITSNNAAAGNGGGGVWISGGLVRNCQIVNNYGAMDNDSGGGGANVTGGIVSNCTFIGNIGFKCGGGIYVNGSGLVTDCLIVSNNAPATYGAGAMGTGGSIKRCTFMGNGATGPKSAVQLYGGSVDSCIVSNNFSVGIGYRSGSARNCLVANNTGDGISCSWGGGFDNCTIVGNAGNGVVLNGSGGATIRNSIIVSNAAGLYNNGGDLANTLWYNNCTTSAIPGGAVLSGNIVGNPQFVAPASGNYRLQPTSPCIDAALYIGLTTDIVGTPRPTRNGYDIGCYEEANSARILNRVAIANNSSAVLPGTLVYDGGLSTSVSIFWGTTDGGTNKASWGNTNSLGPLTSGTLFSNIVNVSASTPYYFRCYASNSYAEVWADASQSFRTYAGSSQDRIWSGAGTNALASNPSNWFGNVAPATGDGIVLDTVGVNSNLTWDAAAPTNIARWYQNQYTGTVTINTCRGTGFTNLNIAGDLTINQGTWTHVSNPNMTQTNWLNVTVGGNFNFGLPSTAPAINVDGMGYQSTSSPGYPAGAIGTKDSAGYGGLGGDGGSGALDGVGSTTYGSITAPVDLGSRAFDGSYGGGAVILNVAGTSTLSSASMISSVGSQSGNMGGGSGGSIFLTTAALTGSGTLRANGVSQNGGGGGGRVAVILTSAGSSFSNFTGAITAYGGNNNGAAGTVYLKTPSDSGTLIINNNNSVLLPGWVDTLMPAGVDMGSFSSIIITNNGVLGITSNNPLNLNTANISGGGYLHIRSDAQVTYPANWTISGYKVWGDGISKLLTNVPVASGAWLGHGRNGATSMGDFYRLNLTLVGNLTVQSNGQINADFCGYANKNGPGAPSGGTGGWDGASYGGKSGDNSRDGTAPTYGMILTPTNIGSGGFDAAFGGGAIILSVAGTTTVATGGLISAMGDVQPNYGGGSGGSIYLTTANLTGGGTIRADGGSQGAAGGGGRVAIVQTSAGNFSGFNGLISAFGGKVGGLNDGAAGTIYKQSASDGAGHGQVLVDNTTRGVWTNTVWTSIPAFTNTTESLAGTSWLVRSNANLRLLNSMKAQSLTMLATTVLELGGNTLTLNALTVTNKVYTAGTYTATQLGGVSFIDAIGGGKVVINARGTGVFFR